MKYKALILDLDGTVIPSGTESTPSPRVQHAIAKAKRHLHVCIATGRPLYLASGVLSQLDLSGPCVLNNGTQIYDPVRREILKEYPLDKASLPPILRIFRKYKKTLRVFDGVKDADLVPDAYPETVFSLFLETITPREADSIVKELERIPGIAAHKMLSWEKDEHHSLEVTSGQATKLHGIVEIGKILQISKDEIIGVGDSYNDFPLLMASGLKIAMGNAVDELKAIADFVAPPVDEDGVATIIEKFIVRE